MDFETAVRICHVRSAIYRESKPSLKYWKGRQATLHEQVPVEYQSATDWTEYDPRDDDCGSLFSFND